MCEQLCPENPLKKNDIDCLIKHCLKVEQDRKLSVNSIKELKRYLMEFGKYCKVNGISSPAQLSPNFLKEYTEYRCTTASPNLKKAVVWSLRKFGKFLNLIQVVSDDPAKNLRHPKFHPRSRLPEYLSETELRKLLEYAANNKGERDFTIISLLASTGLRPKEITSVKLCDIHSNNHYIKVQVKGGWIKKTHISFSMAALLSNYLATRNDESGSLFVNTRGKPISVAWLQRFVKNLGKDANLSMPLTSNCLRHTFATHAADKHGKIITKTLMGHQRLSTTEIYTHLSPRHFKTVTVCHPMGEVERSNS